MSLSSLLSLAPFQRPAADSRPKGYEEATLLIMAHNPPGRDCTLYTASPGQQLEALYGPER